MENKITPNFLGLTPIILFVTLVMGIGLATGNFGTMPILVGFIIATGYALCLNPKDKKITIGEKIDIFCTGGGEKTLILLIIIFLMAGAFYSTTIAIGARDATVNFGLNYIPSRFLLPGIFFISCAISFAMGTSMGTITAVAPVALGLATKIDVSPALMMGIVVGGAMFGDNLSLISDTTIAATRTQSVRMTDKFKVNFLVVLPAVIVTIIALMFVPITVGSEVLGGDYNFVLILPYLLIITLAFMQLDVITVLGAGVASACIIGLFTGAFDLPKMLATIQEGMGWMQDLSIITIFVGGIVELMKTYGGVEWLLQNLTRNIKTKKGAEFGIAALVSILDCAIANNTVAIVGAGPIAKELNQQFKIDPRRTAGLLDVFSCGFQGLVPFGGQLLVAAQLANLSPIDILPYIWYCYLIIICGCIAILIGFPKFKIDATDDYGNVIYSVKN